MTRSLVLTVALLASSLAHARTGTGDPVEVFRERHPDDVLVLDGHLRLRSAAFFNFDLDRGRSPSTGAPLFLEEGHADGVVSGHDARVRIAPSVFLGDFRLFADVDVAAASLGVAADGVPWDLNRRNVGDVNATFLDVRALGVDWMLPFGVLTVGRTPAHFALGIAANDGGDVDDDGGDRGDRIALVMPLYGVLVAGAFDVLPQSTILGEQAVTVGMMKWRAPWEVELYRAAGRPVVDVGASFTYGWQDARSPGVWAQVDAALASADAPPVVRRDARFFLVDAWARVVANRFRFEAEGWVGDLAFDNPSTIPGVIVRRTITGNPAAFAFVSEARLLEPTSDALLVQLEVGAASADPGNGFPLSSPASTTLGSVGGDVTGPQVDLKGDVRFDSGRVHPLHRVDLILWRTLLGGVSEAGYVRARVEGDAVRNDTWRLRLDGNLVYSQAFSASSAPGGVTPLGVELDVGGEATLGDASLRLDVGSLLPLGGLGARGGAAPGMAHMILARLAYAL